MDQREMVNLSSINAPVLLQDRASKIGCWRP